MLPDRCPAAPLRDHRSAPPARGTHHRLGSPLALCLLAVLGGAITLAGIARFATDAPSDVRPRIGLGGLPRATTLGRLLSRIDGDALDDAIGV
ncbi:transposase family protein [Streptomyces sp. NPDC058424]|uniref:transposase family protein n=1 Tax=Streptomyces sp. NPDC058424 TaxID=3346491 RepID=UPI00366A0675